MAKLTSTQHEFLTFLFGPALGNLTVAAEMVGIKDYSVLMTEELTEAIKKRADAEIAMNVPRAVHMINKILTDHENVPYMDKLHKVCADVLDRAGISKQERPNSGGAAIGLVFLPDKKALPEPPDEDEAEVLPSLPSPALCEN